MSAVFRIRKEFPSIPFAHRQWKHSGHCRFIHGHNWVFSFELEIGPGQTLDPNGFVIDFADFKEFREKINEKLDHAFLVLHDDPLREVFEDLATQGAAKVFVVRSASAEHLAEWFFIELQLWLDAHGHTGRVKIVDVTCAEDEKNSASFKGYQVWSH